MTNHLLGQAPHCTCASPSSRSIAHFIKIYLARIEYEKPGMYTLFFAFRENICFLTNEGYANQSAAHKLPYTFIFNINWELEVPSHNCGASVREYVHVKLMRATSGLVS